MMSKRGAIALMITLFFIMAISVSLAIALKQVKTTTTEVSKQEFAMQSSMIVDDVLNLLKNSTELDAIDTADALFIFLSEAAIIPFESNGVSIIIELSSARSMLNINTLVKVNFTPETTKVNALRNYMSMYNVNSSYVDMIVDNMNKVKADNSYYSDIFNENPYLFRDYISSIKHLNTINDFYKKTYNEDSLSTIDFEKLFYFSKNRNTKVDVNHATDETWRLLLGCDELRAQQLSLNAGAYATVEDIGLTPDELIAFNSFAMASYFEKYLDVHLTVTRGDMSSKLRFEYDMNQKKGSNFVYEI